MRRLVVPLGLVVAIVLGACDTEPPTDVGYFDATVKVRVGCIDTTDATPGYDAEWRIASRQPSESSWTGATWHAYNCPDNQGPHYISGSPFTEQITGLRQNRDYQYRLEIRLPPNTNVFHWYDSDGTEDGTHYDGFHTDPFPTVTPQASVGAFRDSMGVNTKTAYIDVPPYANKDDLLTHLQQIGLRKVRDGIWYPGPNGANPGWDRQKVQWPELAAAGIRDQTGYGCATDDTSRANIDDMLDAASQFNLTSFIEAWENPNEVNWQHSPECIVTTDWVTKTRQYAQTFHDEIAERGLDNRQIVGPSCGGGALDCEQNLSPLTGWVDTGNIHPYRGPDIPETADNDKCDDGLHYLPNGGPCIISEFGWAIYDWSNGNCTQNCTGSERVQATYILRAFLDYFDGSDGWQVPRSYVHQLVDLNDLAWYNQANRGGAHEATFGLFKYDWTPRLAATALQRQKDAIGDGSSPLTPLAYQRTGGTGDLRTLVLRRGDGKYVIATWRPIPTGPSGGAGTTIANWQIPDAQDVQLVRPICCAGSATVPLGANGTFSLNTSSEPQFFIVTLKP